MGFAKVGWRYTYSTNVLYYVLFTFFLSLYEGMSLRFMVGELLLG